MSRGAVALRARRASLLLGGLTLEQVGVLEDLSRLPARFAVCELCVGRSLEMMGLVWVRDWSPSRVCGVSVSFSAPGRRAWREGVLPECARRQLGRA